MQAFVPDRGLTEALAQHQGVERALGHSCRFRERGFLKETGRASFRPPVFKFDARLAQSFPDTSDSMRLGSSHCSAPDGSRELGRGIGNGAHRSTHFRKLNANAHDERRPCKQVVKQFHGLGAD